MRWKRPEPRPPTYWKPWFAWRPIVIEDTGEWVWLEWVWRHSEWVSGGLSDGYLYSRYRSDVHWGGANITHLNH